MSHKEQREKIFTSQRLVRRHNTSVADDGKRRCSHNVRLRRCRDRGGVTISVRECAQGSTGCAYASADLTQPTLYTST